MKRVRWSAHARADLERHLAFLAVRSALAGDRMASAIFAAVTALAENNSGRTGRVAGTFEKLVRRQPYIVLFETDERELRILRVVHTSQNWPEGEWPPRE